MKKFWIAVLLAATMTFSISGCKENSPFHNSSSTSESGTELPPEPDNSLSLSANYIILGVGRTKQLTLYRSGEKILSNEVEWSASTTCVSVNNGLITGVSAGECSITAIYGGEQVSASVVVTSIAELTVSESEIALSVGGSMRIEANLIELSGEEIKPAEGKIEFVSENSNIVSVDETGTLIGKTSGITHIIVKSGELSCSVTVNVCEEISTAAEFKAKIQADGDGTFLITQDLDFSGTQYFAIPDFSGTLFGGGHRLFGVFPVNYDLGYGEWGGALFGELTGTVKDLAVEATYESVVRETDGAEQLGIQQFGGTIANYLYGTLENGYIKVKFDIYPWWSTNWNEAGAVCGRICGTAVLRNCIVDYEVTTESSTLGSGKADIHSLYGQGSDCAGARVENVYIFNRGQYKKDYRGTGIGYFGAVEPMFNGVYEYSDETELLKAIQGTPLEAVYDYAHSDLNDEK